MTTPISQSQSTNFLELLKNEPGLLSIVRVGDLVQGTVLEKKSKRMLVDLGKFGTGIVYQGELLNARDVVKNLKVGDPLSAKVSQIDNEEDLIELSLAEADKQKAWGEIQELKEKEEIISIKPSKFNRGGLIAEISGLPAFLPVSQLSVEHYPRVSAEDMNKIGEALQGLIGQELKVKIIDVNPRTNKLIVSERAANEVSIKELAKNYTVGQVIEGIISGVADFGAFIKFTDNPAVEGLIHISELDWRQIENPKEVVTIDSAVKAKIVDIKDGKISLSLKALIEDPWTAVEKRYKEGQETSGTVYSFNPFGAIVNLDKEIQGQIHVTEFGGVDEMKKALALNKEYKFVIESIKPAERRIVLKLKK